MDEIVRLQQQSNDLDDELAKILAESEDKLVSAQTVFDTIGKHQIHISSLQIESRAAPSGSVE